MNIIQLKDYDGEYLITGREGIRKKEDVNYIPEHVTYHPAEKYVVRDKEYYTDIDDIIQETLGDMCHSFLPKCQIGDVEFSKEKIEVLREALVDVFYDFAKANEFYYVNDNINVVNEFDLAELLKKHIKVKDFDYSGTNYFFVWHNFGELNIKCEDYKKFQGVIYFDLLYPLSKADFLEELNKKEVTLDELDKALRKIKNENKE